MFPLIDSHAHIYADAFAQDRAAAIQKAVEANVSKILMPNIDRGSIAVLLQTEAENPEICLPMMGLHPCSVTADYEAELLVMEEWLEKRSFIAIGETGIDLYWDKTFLAQQQEALKIQINWAKKYKLPIVLHTREAFQETYEIIDAAQDGSLRGVFHCFSGTIEEAQKVADLGFYMGIGGVVTFKNGGLDKILSQIALDKIILETDCPYLAPAPHRGKRNEPAYLPLIAQRIAEIKNIDLSDLAEITTRNSAKLFNL